MGERDGRGFGMLENPQFPKIPFLSLVNNPGICFFSMKIPPFPHFILYTPKVWGPFEILLKMNKYLSVNKN